MKKTTGFKYFLGCLISLFIFTKSSHAQMVYIADTNFKAALISHGLSPCIIGDSIDSSCPQVLNTTSLDFLSLHLRDLQGIQAFTNLTALSTAYDSLTYLPPLPNSLINFSCSYNQISSIAALPPSLTNFSCTNTLLTSLPSLPNGLTYINCSYNHITTLPSLPNSLIGINCNNNQLTSLPALPPGLTDLLCHENQLAGLPLLPVTLITLGCALNQLTSLPLLPNMLDTLVCSDNHLTTLPSLPGGLRTLWCYNNYLQSLPSIPDSLRLLNCNNNPLHILPSLNDSLGYLDCSGDSLASLPLLPNAVHHLYCGENQLTSLPALPQSLMYLYCRGNQLNYLPALPNTLSELQCDDNLLTSLPSLPNSLTRLECANNLLTSLPEFPDSMWLFNCSGNLNLRCLPRIKTIYVFVFLNTGIDCLPNYGHIQTNIPNFPPLCDLLNTNNCQVFWSISGKSYLDSSSNCIYDTNDVRLRNIKIGLYSNGNLQQQTITDQDGKYAFETNNLGIYEFRIDTTSTPFTFLCPANGSHLDTLTVTDSLKYDRDFALKCKTGFDIGVTSVGGIGRFRPGATAIVSIFTGDIADFYGIHCASGISGIITVVLNGPVTYISFSIGGIPPTSVTGDTITWNIADFGAVDLFAAFNIIVQTDTTALMGEQICFDVTVTPLTSGDNNPANNSLTTCYTVRNSFDPNEKTVYPLGDIDINGNHWVTYTIQFQNTGNASADNIYIDDTLSSNFDFSTFQILAYSHQPFVQILDGGIARFNFANINLADSNSNEPASHGYVQYKIRLKNSVSVGTITTNTAYINFDFNSPVVTNTTSNMLNFVTNISSIVSTEKQFIIYPNPSRGDFTIQNLQFSNGKKVSLILSDLVGKEIWNSTMNSPKYILTNSDFAKGVYFLRIETEGGITVKKIMKE